MEAKEKEVCAPGGDPEGERDAAEARQIKQAILEGDSAKADMLTSLHVERAMNKMIEAMRQKE